MREFELRQRFNFWKDVDIYDVKIVWLYDDYFGKEKWRTVDTLTVVGFDNLLDAIKTWLKEHHPEYTGDVEVIGREKDRYPLISIGGILTDIEYDIAGDLLGGYVKTKEKHKTKACLDFMVEKMSRGRFKCMFSKNIM